ncbi:hypothetical protein HRI_003931600 [Hibiscus trionum]|uniref:Polyprotein n=1 Tax=Hibiscus trionum TaxID=183268 RepID=A0A9W7IZB1_HIBTR|nr:hypothetical protein HRI_003931600 [Hibiscus trionum]
MSPASDPQTDDDVSAIFSSKKGKMFTNKRVNIVLDELNFLLWKQQVLLIVRSLRLEKFLTGKVKAPPATVVNDAGEKIDNEEYEIFVAQDSALASWLLSTISSQLLSQFVGAETAAEVWSTVNTYFASKSTTTVMTLHCRLKSLKKGDLNMRTYIAQVKEICDALTACGSPVSDLEKIATILNGLPIEYKPFIVVITASREPYTLDAVVSVLIDAEVQQTTFDLANNFSTSVNVAQVSADESGSRSDMRSFSQNQPGRQWYQSGNGGRGRSSRPQCQICGKIGHMADRCWYRYNKSYSDQPLNNQNTEFRNGSPSAHVTTVETNKSGCGCHCAGFSGSRLPSDGQVQAQLAIAGRGQWFVDSGATHHVTPEAENVVDGQDYAGPGKLTVGDGSGLLITKIGQSVLNTSDRALVLHNLMHVPCITKNLLSVSKLARDNSVYLEFHAKSCVIKDEGTGAVLLQGVECDGLYKFDSVCSSVNECDNKCVSAEVNVASTTENSFDLWHRRLGHPAHETLMKVCRDANIVLTTKDNKVVCVACQMGKSHKLPFQASESVYHDPFHLVFTDLWGPAHVTSSGFLYYITFVDAATRHCWLFLLKAKSQAVNAFLQFQQLVKTQFGAVIRELQSDWGGEYKSLSSILAKSGIKHRITCPHTSQQNGVVERKHRHIIELALTLLAQSGVPFKFWSQAVI